MIDSMKHFADKSGAKKEEPAGRRKNDAKGRKNVPVNYDGLVKSTLLENVGLIWG